MRKLNLLFGIMVLAAIALIAGCDTATHSPMSSNDVSANLSDPSENCPTVVSATLNLYLIFESNNPINIHYVTAPWNENTITWNSFGAAYTPTVMGTFVPEATGWKSTDVTALVQGWANGTVTNYGMLLKVGEEVYPAGVAFGSENGDLVPYLTICYDDGTCVDVQVKQDGYIWELYPNDTYGHLTWLYAGYDDATNLEKQSVLEFDIPACTPTPPGIGGNCTMTVDEWLANSGAIGGLLPISIGREGMRHSFMVTTTEDAISILSMQNHEEDDGDDESFYCNAIENLYAQLLAAKLNVAKGADKGHARWVMRRADRFVGRNDLDEWDDLGWWQKGRVLRLGRLLGKYNSGMIGPGACNEED